MECVFLDPGEFSTLYEWNDEAQNFGEEPPFLNVSTYFLGSWSPRPYSPFPPGVAALFWSDDLPECARAVVNSGTVRTPVLPIPFTRGKYQALGRQEPGPGTYENIVGLPPDPGSKFIGVARNGSEYATWITNVFDGTQWSLGTPHVDEGEGALIYFPLLLPALALTNPVISPAGGGRFQIDIVAASNALIQVQYSPSVSGTNWITVTNCTSATGKFTYSTNGIGSVGSRFYRARYVF